MAQQHNLTFRHLVGAFTRHRVDGVEVHQHELKGIGGAVVKTRPGRKLLHSGHESAVPVPGHGREQVVFELELHSSPEVIVEEVPADGISRCTELILHEGELTSGTVHTESVMRSSRKRDILGEDLFRLVCGGDDDCDKEAREQDRTKRDPEWKGGKPSIVDANQEYLKPNFLQITEPGIS